MLKVNLPLFRVEPGQRVFLLKRLDKETNILSVVGFATCTKYVKTKLTFETAFTAYLDQHYTDHEGNPLFKQVLRRVFRNSYKEDPIMYTPVFETDNGKIIYGVQVSYVPAEHYKTIVEGFEGTIIETQVEEINLEILEDDLPGSPDVDNPGADSARMD